MLSRYVWRDLTRNPRRTAVSLVGVLLGVGLFSGVLFFFDGSGASMTHRALAPLALDMQRVLTSPLGGGLELSETLSRNGALRRGDTVRVTLAVQNRTLRPANEVVVRDLLPAPLTYVAGTTTLDGRPVPDPGGSSPLAQGLARTGLNIGTLDAGRTARLSYLARAAAPVAAAGRLRPGGTLSTREDVVPAPANVPSHLTLPQLRSRIAGLPGVASADQLSFVDLPPGSLSVRGRTVQDTVRVFAFDRGYVRHYPSVRVVAGSLRPGAALLSVEAARQLHAANGAGVSLRLPGRTRPLTLPVSGRGDLSRAKPLFYSRESSRLEAFLYVPDSVVLDPATFRRVVLPAYRAATAARGDQLKSLPFLEVDVRLQRARLDADPATALAQTKAVARAVARVAPRQDYLIDNASNTLQVARDDASVAKRMFVFLGLPGALLAAFLTAYAVGILAAAQRREQANLRIRGAHRGHLLRMLAYRTVVVAGLGSLVGTALGLLSATVVLGSGSVFRTAASTLGLTAVLAVTVGMVSTGLALYTAGRRSLRREIGSERGELVLDDEPGWRRYRVDLVLLAAVAVGELVVLRTGVFAGHGGSTYFGQAVDLPAPLMLPPLALWAAGTLLSLRLFLSLATRLPLPSGRRMGPPVLGLLIRTVRRRSRALGGGVLALGLVVAFGTSLAFFSASYSSGKAADARFALGSDLRVTPSVLSRRPQPASFASRLRVGGIDAATAVVFAPENAVLTSAFNEDRVSLAAIEPQRFRRVVRPPDSGFTGGSAARALTSLRRHPGTVLVDAATADSLKIGKGDRVEVLFARGTRHQKRVPLRVTGFFTRFPGFPEGVNVVADLRDYRAATGLDAAGFFLARTVEHDHAGLARAVDALRAGPGGGVPLSIDTTETTLDKDQTSLTALNIRGLMALDSFYTLLMAGAGISLFVFGLILARRREYVTLRAQGLRTGEVSALVLGEASCVAAYGTLAGVLVGSGMGWLLVQVLRPLFVLHPAVRLPTGDVGTLVALVLVATAGSGLVATEVLRRLRPSELLREE